MCLEWMTYAFQGAGSSTGDANMASYHCVTHNYDGCKHMQHHAVGRCHIQMVGIMTCLESEGVQLVCALGKTVQFVQLEGSRLQAGLQVIHQDAANIANSAVYSFA